MERVTKHNASETSLHTFVTEASTLGLPPGKFPRTIETDLGNGQPFHYQFTNGDGALVYFQALGIITLHLLND